MMQQRRAARRAAAISGAAIPIAPALSAAAAKRLVDHYSRQNQDADSSSSESPDSLYSNGSPHLPDQAFEYDGSEAEEVQQYDEAEYESLMAESEAWQTPAWGTWPEVGGLAGAWTPSPVESPSRGTIISLSPAGSLNGRNRASPFRSLGKTPSTGSRRGSDPSLLGFDLASPDRRQWRGGRRRSSVLSNSSVLDPTEDARLRSITGMDLLGRRFSEVVEVSAGSPSGSGLSPNDTNIARRIMSQWSPYSDIDDDDDASEVHTAPYLPTPPVQAVRAVLSNFPLATTALEPEVYADMSSELLISRLSSPGSPGYTARPLPRPRVPPRTFATPPPPVQPSTLLRERARPSLNRAITDYQFPPRAEVPIGITIPRPALRRSTSTPFFSASANGKDGAAMLSLRANRAFPVQRPVPLGVSPLRASARRESVVSDGIESRRASIAEMRLGSGQERRFSAVNREIDLRRVSMDRRISIEVRRMSVEGRKMSADGRKLSVDSRKASVDSRKMSMEGRGLAMERTLSSPIGEEPRRPSAASSILSRTSRKNSSVSRKSSVVSIGEYGYLAPQIVIDAPALSPEEPPVPRFRRNAPPSIVLPEFSFPFNPTPAVTPTITSPDLVTPRFNPMDSFLGRISPMMPSTPSTICPLSPNADEAVDPLAPVASPRTSVMDRGRPISPPEFRDSFLPTFRGPVHSSSISSPAVQLADAPVVPTSSASWVDESRSGTPESALQVDASPPTRPQLASQVSRKAVPKISDAELIVEERKDESMRRRRRKNTVTVHALPAPVVEELAQTPSPPALSPAMSQQSSASSAAPTAHRRAISSDRSRAGPSRPPNRRQVTLPPILDPVAHDAARAKRRSHVVFEESAWRVPPHMYSPVVSPEATPVTRPHAQFRSPAQVQGVRFPQQASPRATESQGQGSPAQGFVAPSHAQKSVVKRASVTFSPEPQHIPSSSSRPSVSRASSFTRFFKSRPQSISGPLPSSVTATKHIRPIIRPVSSDAAGMSEWSGRFGVAP